MDILYYNTDLLNNMGNYCSQELLDLVFNDVKKTYAMKDVEENPEKELSWDISNYIATESNVNVMDKLNVITSYFMCDGIITFDNANYALTIDFTKGKKGSIYMLLGAIEEKGIITNEQFREVLWPWIQEGEEKPFFDVQGK